MKIITAAVAAAAALVATAAPATADSESFVRELRDMGVYAPTANLIAGGYLICERLDAGQNSVDVAMELYLTGTSLTAREAGRITVTAVNELCPRHTGKVRREVNAVTGATTTTT